MAAITIRETTTTTKVYNDIPSFSPLIFQIYIEPDGNDPLFPAVWNAP